MKVKIIINIITFLLFPIMGIILYTVVPTQKYSFAELRLNTDFARININNDNIIITTYDENNKNLLNKFDNALWECSNIKIMIINNNKVIYKSKNETVYNIDNIIFKIPNIHIDSMSNNWKMESNNSIKNIKVYYSLFNFYLIYFLTYIVLFCIYYNYGNTIFRSLTLGYSVFIVLNQNIIFSMGFIEKIAYNLNIIDILVLLRNEDLSEILCK
jgi:hypothetical protein